MTCKMAQGPLDSSLFLSLHHDVFSALGRVPSVFHQQQQRPRADEYICYVAPNDDGRRAYVEAWDVRTTKSCGI